MIVWKKSIFFLSRNKSFAIIEAVIDFYSNKKEWLRYSLISSSKNFKFFWYLSHLYSSLNPSLCAKRKKNNHWKENTNHVNNKFVSHLCLSLRLFKHLLNQLRSLRSPSTDYGDEYRQLLRQLKFFDLYTETYNSSACALGGRLYSKGVHTIRIQTVNNQTFIGILLKHTKPQGNYLRWYSYCTWLDDDCSCLHQWNPSKETLEWSAYSSTVHILRCLYTDTRLQ